MERDYVFRLVSISLILGSWASKNLTSRWCSWDLRERRSAYLGMMEAPAAWAVLSRRGLARAAEAACCWRVEGMERESWVTRDMVTVVIELLSCWLEGFVRWHGGFGENGIECRGEEVEMDGMDGMGRERCLYG